VKRIALLGSTGSIGTQTLQVIAQFPERFQVVGLAAGRNCELLIQQAKEWRPRVVSVASAADAARVAQALGDPAIEVSCDPSDVATCGADLVVAAMVGRVGLEPVLAALAAGTDVALANKEVLVVAGALVCAAAQRSGARLVPLDSEHVAIAQCLSGEPAEALERIVLTASGGPFRLASREQLARARPADALAHPNWTMGAKITIDSATLMNKGFEMIEARWLFDVTENQLDVIVHPESIIHSLVVFRDGNWLAQLAVPDMRIPIATALGMPERLPLGGVAPLDLVALGALHFEAPDPERFPALGLARAALRAGGSAPAVLNAANEVAVAAFLAGELSFPGISELVAEVLAGSDPSEGDSLGAVLEADRRARERARSKMEERRR
jgi:1-deoxy-D-xylulose-5-phosphate reductoisomerase